MSALTALLVFLISFALVAVLFRMPVSLLWAPLPCWFWPMPASSWSRSPSLLSPVSTASRFWRFPFYIFAGVIMEYSGISKC